LCDKVTKMPEALNDEAIILYIITKVFKTLLYL
jgi:hypothetical protein